MIVPYHGDQLEVKFRHRRYGWVQRLVSKRYPKRKVRQVVGHTRAELWCEGHKIAISGAWCSVRDAFDPAVGRKVAFQRLLEEWYFHRDERTLMWKAFFENEEQIRRRASGETIAGETHGDPGEKGEKVEVLHRTNGAGVCSQQAESDSQEERERGGRPMVSGASDARTGSDLAAH